jgi:hypothetical protein
MTVNILRLRFKLLFGHEKSKRRYLCHSCVSYGETRYAELEKPECGTAHLSSDGASLSCILCEQTFKVARKNCAHCAGNVMGDNDDDWSGYCHSCGNTQDDEPIELEILKPESFTAQQIGQESFDPFAEPEGKS